MTYREDGTFTAYAGSSYHCNRDNTWRKCTNDFVAKCWSEGNKAVSATGSLETDGVTVWSYGNPIAWTNSRGDKIVGNYRASAPSGKWSSYWFTNYRTSTQSTYLRDYDDQRGYFVSTTTSIHVGRCMQVANYIYHPDLAQDLAQL
jgi:hypothetical protein